MLAGFGWAASLVNMSTPQVLDWILGNSDAFRCREESFRVGTMCGLVMRCATTSLEKSIQAFMTHVSPDRTIRAQWARTYSDSIRLAQDHFYPLLAGQYCLDKVFGTGTMAVLEAHSLQRQHGSQPLVDSRRADLCSGDEL